MDGGKTLKFTLENFSVTTSTGVYAASLASFTAAQMWESGGFGHPTVIGSGSATSGFAWNNNSGASLGIFTGLTESPAFFISTANTTSINSSSPQAYGIRNIDFTVNIDAIPEPSVSALILGGLGLIALRRKRA